MFRARIERLFVRFRQNGDVSALSAVFDRTAPELIRIALHVARDPAEAEDLVQQTFLSAIESADTFDPRKRLVPWLLGILGNHAKKTARQERRVVDPARLRSAGTTDVTDAASDHEAAGVAGRAIDELPDPYRSVLVLRFRHGMEPAEIASALGVSTATVRSHLHRGLERVRRAVPASTAPALFVGFSTSRGLDAVREVVRLKKSCLIPYFNNADFARRTADMLESDFEGARPLTHADVVARGLIFRMGVRIANLFSPIL